LTADAEASPGLRWSPDRRKRPEAADVYRMDDIGMAAFSLFFMGSPSFLAHQRALQQGRGQSNCQTLFDMSAIPTDAIFA
jgi:hypothetical protein